MIIVRNVRETEHEDPYERGPCEVIARKAYLISWHTGLVSWQEKQKNLGYHAQCVKAIGSLTKIVQVLGKKGIEILHDV